MTILGTVLLASLLGSLHCAGMCGPLVAVALGDSRVQSYGGRAMLHGAYHGARLLTYTAVGLVCGLLGAGLNWGSSFFGVQRAAALVVGCVMVAVGSHRRLAVCGSALVATARRGGGTAMGRGRSARGAGDASVAEGGAGRAVDRFSALRLVVPVCDCGGGDGQSAVGCRGHGRVLVGDSSGFVVGGDQCADAHRRRGPASAVGHVTGHYRAGSLHRLRTADDSGRSVRASCDGQSSCDVRDDGPGAG